MAKNYKTTDTFSHKPRSQYNHNELNKGLKIPAGIYRGIVVDVEDPNKDGRIKVHIMKFYGTFPLGEESDPDTLDPDKYIGAMWCRTMVPIGGVTAGPNQTSYGFSGSPPDINNEVVVAFSGDTHSGIVLGVLLDSGKNEGLATSGVRGETADGTVAPRFEVPRSAQTPDTLPAEHPQAIRLREQGLADDLIRGPASSSPRRDPASRVSAITTPAGHALTLDDGNGEDASDLGIRMRTAGGAQILMDDTNGLTYINNRDGNVWIELNRNGDIDIYAGGSVNIHSPGNFNLHSGADFNLQASGNINMRAGGNIGIEALGNLNLKGIGNTNIQADGNGNILVGGNLRLTAGRIDLNGPAAEAAETAAPGQLAGNSGVTESISPRVPEAEPWDGHLDVARQLPRGGGSGGGGGSVGRVQQSESYYYGTPSDIRTYDDQTGQWAQRQALASGGDYLNILPGVDMRVDPRLVAIVNEVARQAGIPLTVVDGFRESAGRGARNSQHLYGKAFDISSRGIESQQTRLELCEIASTLGITGIGIYSGGSLHFDIREGQRVVWGDDFSSRTVPSWARDFASRHNAGEFFQEGAFEESLSGRDFEAGDFGTSEINPDNHAIEQTSRGMTPERAQAIREFAERYNMSPEALAGIFDIESGLDPSSRGGASNRFYGIFQLEDRQIPALTQRALGQTLTPSQYRQLGFNDQLRVYESYINQAGILPNSNFFTRQPSQDASRLWALQLAPSNARRLNYNDPNTVISRTVQADAISARRGLVTVGSVQRETVRRGGL